MYQSGFLSRALYTGAHMKIRSLGIDLTYDNPSTHTSPYHIILQVNVERGNQRPSILGCSSSIKSIICVRVKKSLKSLKCAWAIGYDNKG